MKKYKGIVCIIILLFIITNITYSKNDSSTYDYLHYYVFEDNIESIETLIESFFNKYEEEHKVKKLFTNNYEKIKGFNKKKYTTWSSFKIDNDMNIDFHVVYYKKNISKKDDNKYPIKLKITISYFPDNKKRDYLKYFTQFENEFEDYIKGKDMIFKKQSDAIDF